MHISYKPLWHTLVERNMRKEDLRLAAGLTTNMIANMGKGKNISMETLVRICEALNCCILMLLSLNSTCGLPSTAYFFTVSQVLRHYFH